MEDLLYLVLIIFAVGIAVAVVLAGFAIAASIAATCVFGAAVATFLVTMYRGIVHRGGVNAASGPDEPSFRAYYRGQVWTDLGLAARAGWISAKDETARMRDLVPTSWDDKVQVVVRLALTVYAFVGLAVGTLLAVVIGIIPAICIGIFAAGAWAIGAPLRAAESLRRRRTGAFFDCHECHDRFPLAHYVCPNCDARHALLAPGPFGVLLHRCTCGARLPAVRFRGRERLTAECPQGHPFGESVGVVRTFHVPVAGGPSTGKSTYLAAALVELDAAAASGTLATTVQRTSRQAYDRVLDGFRKGIIPRKTSGVPPAMVAEIRGKSKSALLYAYDVAGENYASEEELRRDPAHGLAEGVVLLVDPFSLDRVKTDLEEDIAGAPAIMPSVESPQRMLERLIGVLEEQGVELSKVSAALCVTKIDALGIGDAIDAAPGTTDHARTRAWLEREGAGNFLRAAEAAFLEVRCFGVSALGRTPGASTGSFVPRGASAPLLWLLTRAGIQPATPGEAQETQSKKLAGTAPLDVTPKRPIFTLPLDAVGQRPYVANLAVGLLAVAALVLTTLPFIGDRHAGAGLTNAAYIDSVPESGSDTDTSSSDTSETDTSETDTSSSDTSETDTSSSDTSKTDTTSPASAPPPANPNSPSKVLRRHFQRISRGDYEGAYTLFSAQGKNTYAGWVGARSAAEPYINVVDIGPTRFLGSGVADVHVKFYARDSVPTQDSDTQCRLFEGSARMRKESGLWVYDPGANQLSKTDYDEVLPECEA